MLKPLLRGEHTPYSTKKSNAVADTSATPTPIGRMQQDRSYPTTVGTYLRLASRKALRIGILSQTCQRHVPTLGGILRQFCNISSAYLRQAPSKLRTSLCKALSSALFNKNRLNLTIFQLIIVSLLPRCSRQGRGRRSRDPQYQSHINYI